MLEQTLSKNDVEKFFMSIFGLDLNKYPEKREALYKLFKKAELSKEDLEKVIQNQIEKKRMN